MCAGMITNILHCNTAMSLNQTEKEIRPKRRGSVAPARGKKCSRGRSSITEDRKKEMISTFLLLDKSKSGLIEAKQLLLAIKILGFDVTSGAVDRSLKSERLSKNEFMSYMLSYAQSQDMWCFQEMRDLFRCFDREDCGFITDGQIRRILNRFGEDLTDGEVEVEVGQYFIRENHHIEFDSFIMLLSEEP